MRALCTYSCGAYVAGVPLRPCVLFGRTLGYEAVHRDCSSPLRRVLPPHHASSASYHHNHLAALASTLAIHDELRPKPEEDTGCCCVHVSATLHGVGACKLRPRQSSTTVHSNSDIAHLRQCPGQVARRTMRWRCPQVTHLDLLQRSSRSPLLERRPAAHKGGEASSVHARVSAT